MNDLTTFFASEPYSWDKAKKSARLTAKLKELTGWHRTQCAPYRRILDCLGVDIESVGRYEDLPFLPVPLFKSLELRSVAEESVFKTLTSSGTSGQVVSRIYLDRETAALQQKTLVKIVSSFTGAARLPMLIIDSPSVIKDRKMFSARGAGILGFSMFGVDRTYALDDEMRIDLNGIEKFLERHVGERILLFGFTFMIWQFFYKELLKIPGSRARIDLSKGVLIHGGGWKKLANEAVSPMEFKDRLESVCGLADIHDYYGMVEQTGAIYMQCECGHLHASNFSDVLMRRGRDFSLCEHGERGIVQVVSVLPYSYPGHSILTQDEGTVLGEDDCPCGRKGKYFVIYGRLKNAEVRGCSDTFERK